MSNWLIHKYIGLISSRLPYFKRKGPELYNFRCVICGDSQKRKNIARAYIYEKQGNLMFHCHNCSLTMSVPNFIKSLDQTLYNEYQYEKLQNNKTEEQIDLEKFVDKMKKPVFMKAGPLKGLKKVSQLSIHDPVKQFIVKRGIPNPYHAKLFSCPNYMHFCNTLIPNKFSKNALEHDETRLLIPFLDANKNLHAFQGRSLGPSQVKYITIILDENVPKVFGLDTVNFNKTVYVLEGPIDSMFVNNSIATAGGDLVSSIGSFDKSKMVIVYDNEPRSRETIKKIDKAIMQGYSVVIWPDNMNHKDINDMILAGLSSEFIEHIMKTHTYKDLAAKLALTKWSKI